MQGHVPMPPQPHFPTVLSPAIGYIATREPQPLEDRSPEPLEWWEDEIEEWGPRHPRFVKITAVVVSISLVVAGLGTVFELLLTTR
jgi:hypothetical protein